MTWREAYLKQAKSDFECFNHFNKNRFPICHQLHYLQMATEKLAKSLLCAFGKQNNIPPKKRHDVFVSSLRQVKKHPNLSGSKSKREAFSRYIDSLLPIAKKVEVLAPALANQANGTNPEYPWIENHNLICVPIDYTYSEISEDEIRKMQKLFNELLSIADQL